MGKAYNFAESWLGVHPDDEIMLMTYTKAAESGKQTTRVNSFLRSGMTNRPVRIAWHRTYQELHNHPAEFAGLLREYDGLLQSEATNSALLYLRGRLEMDRATARDYFKRAADQDPQNPYAAFALGYDRMAAADWSAAKPLLARAVELDPRDHDFSSWLFITRLALGEAADIEHEARQKLTRDPLNYAVEFELFDALAAQNKPEEVLKTCDGFVKLCHGQYGSDADPLANAAQYHAFYAAGEFDKMKALAMTDKSDTAKWIQAISLIERGQIDEAVKALPSEMDVQDHTVFCLVIAVAYAHSGNETAAAQWRSRGIDALGRGNEDSVQAANLMKRGTPPTHQELADLAISPKMKAVICVVLAQEYPQARGELTGFARKLNADRTFPYHLIQRASDSGIERTATQ